MEIKKYSTASNARRAAKSVKFDNVETDIRAVEGGHIVIVTVDNAHPEVDDVVALCTAKGFSAHLSGTADIVEPKNSGGYISESSDHEGVCAEVHALCNQMVAENPDVKRKDIIEAARARGIAYGTVRTQYQRWKAKRA